MAHAPDNPDELLVPLDVEMTGSLADVGLSVPRFFPPPTVTSPEGLLCVGGRLSPDWLLDAYRHGIFPWPVRDDEPRPRHRGKAARRGARWWSPDPRAVMELGSLHVSRRLQRTLRSGKFQVTCDRDFEGVIRGCATAQDRRGNTWLTPAMIDAYLEMHRLGHAHSVEAWCRRPLPPGEGRGAGESPAGPHPSPLPKREGIYLAGGTYGVAVGGLFAAESMFYRVRDASKVALVHLVAHLRERGYGLLDVQQWTPHTGRMGAVEIPRLEYLRRLAAVIDAPVTFGDSLAGSPQTRNEA